MTGPWISGESLSPSRLNAHAGAAALPTGLSSNTLVAQSGNTINLLSDLSVGRASIATALEVGGVPSSASGILSLRAHSQQSDYIFFQDAAGIKSNFLLGLKTGDSTASTVDGLNLYDVSDNTMIVRFSSDSVRFYPPIIAPVFDTGGALASTYNAALFLRGSSKESQIQAAITAAAADGIARVYVPANLYPYSAASVSFNSRVQVVREGGDWTAHDVKAYGAGFNQSDTSAWQAAVNGAGFAGGVVRVPKSAYTINRVTVTQSNTAIIIDDGTTITRTVAGVADQGMLDIRGGIPDSDTTLLSVGSLGQFMIRVGSSSGFTVNDYIEIESSATIGAGGESPYIYEYNIIEALSGSTVTVKHPLRNTYNVSPTVTIRRAHPLTGIVVHGGNFVGPAGTAGDCLRLQHCISPQVEKVSATSFGDRGIVLYRCFGGTVRECYATNGTDPTNSWGITLNSCERVTIEACEVRDHDWDGFDLVFGTMYCQLINCRAFNCGDVGFVVGHGLLGHHNVVTNCNAIGCGAAGFTIGNSTYSGDHDNLLIGCKAFACGNHGFTLRQDSARNRYTSCTAELNTGSGFNVINSTCVNNTFVDCSSNSNTIHGIDINAPRTTVVGGRLLGNANRGCSLSGASASVIIGTLADASGLGSSHNFLALAGSHRAAFIGCRAENAAAGLDGFRINVSTDVVVADPICLNNSGWGVRIVETAGDDCIRSRLIGGTFSGNTSGNFTSNQVTPDPSWTQDRFVLPTGSAVAPSSRFTSEASLGLFRSGVSTMALSYGTFNMNQARLVSVRTTGTSLSSTQLNVSESAFFVGGASGATIGLRVNGIVYLWASSSTTIG